MKSEAITAIQVLIRRLRLAIAMLCLVTVGVGWAQQPQGGQPVAFQTLDQAGRATELRGLLYQASAPVKGAVVLMHGSSGWTDYREGHYARALSAAGYQVLAVDSFGPRGIANTGEDQKQLGMGNNTRDAFAARRHLLSLGAPPNKMAVMGFSRGGVVALRAADRTYVQEEADRFAAAVAFYPGCNNRAREPKPASVVYMALGEKDDYTGVKPCQEIAADFAAAGGKIEVKVYPDSTHGFDGNPANTRMFRLPTIENYMDCTVYVEPDGRQTLAGQTFGASEMAIFDLARKTCVKSGATMWTNLKQKEIATKDVIEFLNKTIGAAS